jgi:hypothetical protein
MTRGPGSSVGIVTDYRLEDGPGIESAASVVYGFACWPLVPKIAGSLPTEAVGFFRLGKFTACLPSEGEVK